MKKLIPIILCALIILAGIGTYWSATHYLIQTRNGFLVLPKRFITFQNTFLDIQSWQHEDFEEHASIRNSLKDNGYGALLEKRPTESQEEKEADGEATDKKEIEDGQEQSSAKDKNDSQDEDLNHRIQEIAEDIKQRVTELIRREKKDEETGHAESESTTSEEGSDTE